MNPKALSNSSQSSFRVLYHTSLLPLHTPATMTINEPQDLCICFILLGTELPPCFLWLILTHLSDINWNVILMDENLSPPTSLSHTMSDPYFIDSYSPPHISFVWHLHSTYLHFCFCDNWILYFPNQTVGIISTLIATIPRTQNNEIIWGNTQLKRIMSVMRKKHITLAKSTQISKPPTKPWSLFFYAIQILRISATQYKHGRGWLMCRNLQNFYYTPKHSKSPGGSLHYTASFTYLTTDFLFSYAVI